MAEKLAATIAKLDPQSPLFAKCENCGYGIRHVDGCSERKWCKRCIGVYARCQNLKESRAEAYILAAVGERYYDAKLDDLAETLSERLKGLQHGRDVYFCGPVGTGKTYALAALFRHYVYGGYECTRINFDDFCVEVRSTMCPGSKVAEWHLIEPLKLVDKLFIDDLGLRSTPESQFAYSTLFSILNKRQERMLPTFISSNKSLTELGQVFDQRIESRLQGALCWKFGGADRRSQHGGKGD